MLLAVFLDAEPLSLVTKRHTKSQDAKDCFQWMKNLLAHHIDVYVPEITEYEIGRELVRAKKQRSLEQLNEMREVGQIIPITSEAMLRAAEIWADARNRGMPTAEDAALDGDVIFAAQVLEFTADDRLAPDEFIAATSNVRHISRYVNAAPWRDITP